MGRTVRRDYDNKWDDSRPNIGQEYDEHHEHIKEKRLNAAIHTKNLDALIELSDDDEDDIPCMKCGDGEFTPDEEDWECPNCHKIYTYGFRNEDLGK